MRKGSRRNRPSDFKVAVALESMQARLSSGELTHSSKRPSSLAKHRTYWMGP